MALLVVAALRAGNGNARDAYWGGVRVDKSGCLRGACRSHIFAAESYRGWRKQGARAVLARTEQQEYSGKVFLGDIRAAVSVEISDGERTAPARKLRAYAGELQRRLKCTIAVAQQQRYIAPVCIADDDILFSIKIEV